MFVAIIAYFTLFSSNATRFIFLFSKSFLLHSLAVAHTSAGWYERFFMFLSEIFDGSHPTPARHWREIHICITIPHVFLFHLFTPVAVHSPGGEGGGCSSFTSRSSFTISLDHYYVFIITNYTLPLWLRQYEGIQYVHNQHLFSNSFKHFQYPLFFPSFSTR